MARIFISLSGDGRGHATRVRTLVESLRRSHSLVLHTFGQGHEFLSHHYEGSSVRVRCIPGLRFGYGVSGSVSIRKSVATATEYLLRLPEFLAGLRVSMAVEQPDLVISDFEPALPRAARQMGIPHISLNHQHFLLTYDLGSLPFWLRLHALYMGWVVRAYDSPAVARIVSSFYFPPLRPGNTHVTQTGVLLRPTVLEAEPSNRSHLVAYWRRQAPPGALESLAALNRDVHIYGLGRRPAFGRLRFLAADEEGFVADLASCSALICTAGNQLVGEAIYLRKAVLAIPEPGNYEQYINAHFLARMNAGAWIAPHKFTTARVRHFLDRTEQFRSTVPRAGMHGLPTALRVVHRYLGSSVDLKVPARPEPVMA